MPAQVGGPGSQRGVPVSESGMAGLPKLAGAGAVVRSAQASSSLCLVAGQCWFLDGGRGGLIPGSCEPFITALLLETCHSHQRVELSSQVALGSWFPFPEVATAPRPAGPCETLTPHSAWWSLGRRRGGPEARSLSTCDTARWRPCGC